MDRLTFEPAAVRRLHYHMAGTGALGLCPQARFRRLSQRRRLKLAQRARQSCRKAATMSCGSQGNTSAECGHLPKASCAGRCRCEHNHSRPRDAWDSNQALPFSRPVWRRSPRRTATNSKAVAQTATGPAEFKVHTGHFFSNIPQCGLRPEPTGRRIALAGDAVKLSAQVTQLSRSTVPPGLQHP